MRPALILWCICVSVLALCLHLPLLSAFFCISTCCWSSQRLCVFVSKVWLMPVPASPWRGDLWLPGRAEACKGERPGISMSYRRTTNAWIAIMCQLFRMRSNCTIGRGPRVPLRCGFPPPGHAAKPSRTLPPWPIPPPPNRLPTPTPQSPHHPPKLFHPLPPALCSTFLGVGGTG